MSESQVGHFDHGIADRRWFNVFLLFTYSVCFSARKSLQEIFLYSFSKPNLTFVGRMNAGKTLNS